MKSREQAVLTAYLNVVFLGYKTYDYVDDNVPYPFVEFEDTTTNSFRNKTDVKGTVELGFVGVEYP